MTPDHRVLYKWTPCQPLPTPNPYNYKLLQTGNLLYTVNPCHLLHIPQPGSSSPSYIPLLYKWVDVRTSTVTFTWEPRIFVDYKITQTVVGPVSSCRLRCEQHWRDDLVCVTAAWWLPAYALNRKFVLLNTLGKFTVGASGTASMLLQAESFSSWFGAALLARA